MTRERYNQIKEMDEEELIELFFEKVAEDSYSVDRWGRGLTLSFYIDGDSEEAWLALYLLRKYHLNNVNSQEESFSRNIEIEDKEEQDDE